jgi:cytochrome c-type biogenesis protein CcmH
MTLFLILAALMLIAALAFVLVPLLRGRADGTAIPSRQLRALDAAREAGVIDAAEYEAKRAALAVPDAAHAGRGRGSLAVVLALAILLPATALVLYRAVGTPAALDPANLVAATPQGDQAAQMEQAIERLAARLKANPADAEGWALLGRAYQVTQRPGEALDAFRHAHQLVPDNAGVTIEYAQALAMADPNRSFDGEARSLLEGVIGSDPTNQRALGLLGISDYQAQRYAAAIARWNTLLPLLEPGSDVRASIERQIAEAEALRDGKASPAAALASSDATSGTPKAAEGSPDSASAESPRLTVEVRLDPKLQSQLDPDATLFIFARAAEGPPMPLAIERLNASDLPVTVVLDDSKGMLPNLQLGMFPQVVVGARVSKSGNATPQSGDLEAVSEPIEVTRTQPVLLDIDRVVP